MKLFRGSPPVRGFTLIELMVSLTILAALMTIAFSGFRASLTIWEKGNAHADALDERVTTLNILRDQLRGALPLMYSREEQLVRRQRLAFEGRSNAVQFISRVSWQDGPNVSPRWVELTWQERSESEPASAKASSNGTLNVEERAIVPPWNLPASEPLWSGKLSTFEDFQLSYLRRGRPGRSAEWLDSWVIADMGELPAAVRIMFKQKGDSRTVLIPLDLADANWRGLQFQ